MVVLWVVLEDLGLLLVVEGWDELVDAAAEGFPPLLALDEPAMGGQLSLYCIVLLMITTWQNVHLLGKLDVKLARSEESKLERSSQYC